MPRLGLGLGLGRSSGRAAAPALDRVVNFVPTGNDGLYQDNAIFNAGGGFAVAGVWMNAFMYFDGTNWTGDAISVSDPTVVDRYIELDGNGFRVRYSSTVTTTAMANPSVAGWYLCTGFATRHATDATRLTRVDFWRSGVNANTVASITGVLPANLTRIALGYRARSTPDVYATFMASGFAIGTGSPANLHTWLYNGGAFGRKVSDYTGWVADGATLTAHWLGARTGAATLSGTEAALQDTVGALDSWTLVGAPVWGAVTPPFEASVATATFGSATVPSGVTNTLVVTATLPAGRSWAGATVDLAKVYEVWTPRGFGPLSPSGSSISIAGTTVTVTFTLPRSVYASETINLAFEANWISSATVQTNATTATASNLSAAADPVNAPGISMGKVAWGFTTPTPAGFYHDSIAWVTSGAEVSVEYPARTTFGGLAVHGADKNPKRTVYSHPYDQRHAGVDYVASTALPYTLAANDSAIKSRSNPNPTIAGGGTSLHPVYILEYGGLHARASAPAANEFAPPIVYETPASRPAGPTINTGTLTLPSYANTGLDKPAIADVLTNLARFNPAGARWSAVETRRMMTPSGMTRQDGYGLELVQVIGPAGVLMIGDDAVADRRNVAKWQISLGVQTYHGIVSSALTKLPGDGGQNQGFLLPVAAYLAWAGNTAALGTLATDVITNELGQTAFVDTTLYNRMVAAQPTTPTYNSVGVYEWFLKGTGTSPDQVATYYDPRPTAEYRNLNAWAGELMALHALGFVHSSWAAFKGYVVRANLANDPTGNDYPEHFASYYTAANPGGFQIEEGFWTNHWTAINAVAQTVG